LKAGSRLLASNPAGAWDHFRVAPARCHCRDEGKMKDFVRLSDYPPLRNKAGDESRLQKALYTCDMLVFAGTIRSSSGA
jgi:hypothetical protein